ncbi:MAG: glycosyltransferase [Chitinophagaceae bacterium]|nr:glycosyltransferase [Chitinophagaceae bacterium]
MPDQLPIVTVCTLIYNSGNWVIEALRSVQQQSYPEKFIQNIVIDDGSSDDSAQVVAKWIRQNNFNCLFIKHDQNQGICKSLNESLQHAKGKYFTSLGDDLWKVNRLEMLVATFENLSSDYALIHTPVDFCDENDVITKYNFKRRNRVLEGCVFTEILKNGSMVIPPSAIYRTLCINEAGNFNEQIVFEDLDMLLKLSWQFKFKWLPEALTIYRLQDKISSSNTDFFKKDGVFTLPLYYIQSTSHFLGKRKEIDNLIRKNQAAAKRVYHLSKDKLDVGPVNLFFYSVFDSYVLDFLRSERHTVRYLLQLTKLLIFRRRAGYSIRDIAYLLKIYVRKI